MNVTKPVYLVCFIVSLVMASATPATGMTVTRSVPVLLVEEVVEWEPISSGSGPTIDFVIGGESGEFGHNYHPSEVQFRYGYVDLVWTHTANTTLEFIPSPPEDKPNCNDSVYFGLSYEWDREEYPIDAYVDLYYKLDLTGDFETEPNGSQMFDVFVCLIDSSGNWESLIDEDNGGLVFTDVWQSLTLDLDWFNIMDGWGGMISDDQGVQEDPSDVLELVVGIAPSLDFESFEDSEPWREWDGSVAFSASVPVFSVKVEEGGIMDPVLNLLGDYTLPVLLLTTVIVVVALVVVVSRRRKN